MQLRQYVMSRYDLFRNITLKQDTYALDESLINSQGEMTFAVHRKVSRLQKFVNFVFKF